MSHPRRHAVALDSLGREDRRDPQQEATEQHQLGGTREWTPLQVQAERCDDPESHHTHEQHQAPEADPNPVRSEEHTSELQSRLHLVCRLLLEKKKKNNKYYRYQLPR